MRTMDVNRVWGNCAYQEVMSEQELRAVPVEPPDQCKEDPICRVGAWSADGSDDSDDIDEDPGDDSDDEQEEDEDEDEDEAEVLGAVRPLVARIFAQYKDALEVVLCRHPGAPVSEAVGEQMFLSGLARQVLGVIAPTLVVELSAARANGMLRGESVDARFHNFLDDLDDESRAPALLREYPVLGQLLRAVLTARADARVECVRHLCEDWPAIQQRWPALAEARLAGVAAAVGDRRCGGRTTLVLGFEPSGLLIYKPRSIAVDAHFQELLEWLNARGANPALRTLQMLDRGDHGWVEAVVSVVCESSEAATRFCERAGGLMAVLHALEAADLSSTALVACGEHPVLVDTETLFQSQPRHRTEGRAHTEGNAARQLAAQGLADSILRIGLLPRSGLDGAQEVMASRQAASCCFPLTTTCTASRQRLDVEGRVLPEADEIALLNDISAIERGFTRMYRLLCALRPLLLKEDGPLWRFATDRVRVTLRPSFTYSALLMKGTSPEVLRDGVERERLFERLWAEVDQAPELARVIHAERDDLERGDVPCFTTMPASRAIWTSSGIELPGFYDRSGLEQVEARLRRLGDDDLERQRWLLRVSLASLSPDDRREWLLSSAPLSALASTVDEVPRRRVPIGPLMAPPLDPEEFVEAAGRIARRLERLAFVDGVRASWAGVMTRDDGASSSWRRSIEPLGLDLRDGLPGVALFLARLARVTDQPRYRLLAEQAAVSMLEALNVPQEWTSIGAFMGWGGVIYALAHLGVLLESSDYIDRADALVPLVAELVDRDEALDINAGSAGAIMGLAALHAVKPSDRIVSVTRACASRLLVRAERLPIGYGWRASGASTDPPLIGFPEGASGIALALLTASALTDDAAAHDIARQAIEYERSAFVPAVKNWPDVRAAAAAGQVERDARDESSDDLPQDGASDLLHGSRAGLPSTRAVQVVSTTTWCRGAPGIGLARLAGLRYLDYWRIRADVSDAVKATLRSGFGGLGGFGGSHCLCHGDLGSLEFLAVAAARLGDVPLRRDVAQIAAGLLRAIDERGWRFGTPRGVETPGYLTGLAGIGDGLLRIAEPRLASVLMLEAPASPGVRVPRGRRQTPAEGGAEKRVLQEEMPIPVAVLQP